MAAAARDRDVRQAIVTLLEATGQFDGVYLGGLPEDGGQAAGNLRAVALDQIGTTETDRWDSSDSTSDLVMTSQVRLIVMARDDDGVVRDEMAENLVDVIGNTLNGVSIASLTLPPFTRIKSWAWQKETPPERRITILFEYQYLVPGWNQFDTTE